MGDDLGPGSGTVGGSSDDISDREASSHLEGSPMGDALGAESRGEGGSYDGILSGGRVERKVEGYSGVSDEGWQGTPPPPIPSDI